jgi:DNA-binding transcriptional ArsR family regulator
LDGKRGHAEDIVQDIRTTEFWNFGKTHYFSVMPAFTHPNLADVPLPSVLHALADPTRLEIVRRLNEEAGCAGMACNSASPCDLPRATMSNHFNVLRSAGLIESRKQGTMVLNRLRRQELDARFPGLLDAVLQAEAAT